MRGFGLRGRGGFFLHGRRAERLEVNHRFRHAPRFKAIGQTFHERAAAAEVVFKIIRWQNFLQKLNAHAAFVMKIFSLHVFLTRLAVGDVQMDVVVFRREFFQFGFVNMFADIADAEEKIRLAFGTAGSDGVGHAQHRRDAHATGEQHDGI